MNRRKPASISLGDTFALRGKFNPDVGLFPMAASPQTLGFRRSKPIHHEAGRLALVVSASGVDAQNCFMAKRRSIDADQRGASAGWLTAAQPL